MIDQKKAAPRPTTDEQPDMTDLKRAVNDLLWSYLPGLTTIARAEEIAGDIYDAVADEWDAAPVLQTGKPTPRARGAR